MTGKPRAKMVLNAHIREKEKAEKFLGRVPEECVFWCCNGTIFKDMKDLANGLIAMSDATFYYHVNSEKNDFCNWVRDVIQDEDLAGTLINASTRLEAASFVSDRLLDLGARLGRT